MREGQAGPRYEAIGTSERRIGESSKIEKDMPSADPT